MTDIKETLLKCGFSEKELADENKIDYNLCSLDKSGFEVHIVMEMETTEKSMAGFNIINRPYNIVNNMVMLEKDVTVEMLNELFRLCKIEILVVDPENLDEDDMEDEPDEEAEPDNILTKEKLIKNGFTWFEYMDNSTNNHYGECSVVNEDYTVCVHFLFEPYYEVFGPETSFRSQKKKTHNIKTFNRILKQCGIDLVIQ